MAGLLIPNDRTTKQPMRACCFNPACREKSTDERFEFEVEHDRSACPKCGAEGPPYVHPLVLVHFLVANTQGPIVGTHGRYSLACDPGRPYIATDTNLEAGTNQLPVVNCPGCLSAVTNALKE